MRHQKIRLLIFMAGFVFFLGSAGMAIGQLSDFDPTKLKLGYEPEKTTDKIEVVLGETNTGTRIPLFLSNIGDQAIPGIRLYTILKSEAGRPAPVGTLQFLDPEQNNASLGRIELKPRLKSRIVELQLSDFTSLGVYRGLILAEVNGNNYQLAELTVNHLVGPTLKINEAGDGTTITLRTSNSNLKESIFMLETGGIEASRNFSVTLEVSELRLVNTSVSDSTANSFSLTPATQNQIIPIEPFMRKRLAIEGNVPQVGEYQGLLSIKYRDQNKPPTEGQKSYQLVIKRETPKVQLNLAAFPVLEYQRVCPILCGVDIQVPVNITETNNLKIDYNPIALVKLAKIAPGTLESGVAYNSVIELAPTITPTITAASLTPNLSSTITNTTALVTPGVSTVVPSPILSTTLGTTPQLLTLPSNRLQQIKLQINNVQGVGQYQGTLRIDTSDGAAGQTTFTVFIKDAFWCPALVILMGVLGSVALRSWLQIGRPRLLDNVKIRTALDEIDRVVPESQNQLQNELRQAFRRALLNLYELNTITPQSDIEAKTKVIADQLAFFVRIKRVLDLRGNLQNYILDAGQRKEFESKLNAIEQRLASGQLEALTKETAEGADKLYGEIQEASKAAIQDAISQLEQSIEKTLTSLPGSSLDQSQKENFMAEIEAIEPQLEEARTQLAQNNLQPAVTAYNQAHDSYRLIATELENIQRQRLVELLNTLIREAEEVVTKLNKDKPPDYEKNIATFNSLIEQSRKAQRKPIGEMQTDYSALQKQYNDLVKDLRSQGLALGPGASASSLTPLTGSELATVGSSSPVEVLKAAAVPQINIPDLGELRNELKRRDNIALAITIFVAVIFGLQLLWVNKATFGSAEDYIGMLLWGFGLHELNRVALPQVAGLNLPFFPANPGNDPKTPSSQP